MWERYRSRYLVVEEHAPPPIARVLRTTEPFPGIADVHREYAEVIRELDAIGRRGRVLLVDMRDSPGRNDPKFEEAMRSIRPAYLGGFVRVGVLVRSVVGTLQIKRYAREDGIVRLIADDPGEIAAYLGIDRSLVR